MRPTPQRISEQVPPGFLSDPRGLRRPHAALSAAPCQARCSAPSPPHLERGGAQLPPVPTRRPACGWRPLMAVGAVSRRRCPCQVVVAGKASRLPLYLHTQNTARVLASTQCLGLATPGTRCALAWRCPGAPRSLLRGMWPPGLCPLQRANCSFRLDASAMRCGSAGDPAGG